MKNLSAQEKNDLNVSVFSTLGKDAKMGFLSLILAKIKKFLSLKA